MPRPLCFQVLNVFNITEANFPDASVRVSTLDAFFEVLHAAMPGLNLTVVTGEIGDSWIYGAFLPPFVMPVIAIQSREFETPAQSL